MRTLNGFSLPAFHHWKVTSVSMIYKLTINPSIWVFTCVIVPRSRNLNCCHWPTTDIFVLRKRVLPCRKIRKFLLSDDRKMINSMQSANHFQFIAEELCRNGHMFGESETKREMGSDRQTPDPAHCNRYVLGLRWFTQSGLHLCKSMRFAQWNTTMGYWALRKSIE